MRCRHCGKHIYFEDLTLREWVHSDTGRVECIIAGSDAGTSADPKDENTWEEDE